MTLVTLRRQGTDRGDGTRGETRPLTRVALRASIFSACRIPSRLVTPAEYLEFERRSEQKHEYLAGRVYAMAGASPKHNLVCGNVIRALGERPRGRPCAVMPSDQHVYVEATELGTYPA